MELSVVVPLAPNEKLHPKLIQILKDWPEAADLILSSADGDTLSANAAAVKTAGVSMTVKLTDNAGNSRAKALNAGAQKAEGQWLLFLHADSYMDPQSIGRLYQALRQNRSGEALYYFDLVFYDGPLLMKLNQWGVNFRCSVLKTPFGDQGLCLRKRHFEALGQYDVNAPYGEDHLLVRRAKSQGTAVCSIKTPLYTSARKYAAKGWLKTTLNHQWLWYKQIYQDRQNQGGAK